MVVPKSTRSLHGKSIYLDLFGYRNVAEFEKNLQLLGAVVEKCFSKEVSHVITNRATVINSQTRSASKNASTEAAVASPLSLSPFGESGANQSPFAISPTMMDSVCRPMTRGQAIVQKAMLSRKRGSTNVVECAQQWNIKVIHIDAAVKWMRKELGALEAQKQEKKSKAMQLKRPYIKFEESRSRFCPEFKSLAGFPSLEFNGPRRTCPFDQFAQPCSVENAGNEAESSPCCKASAADDMASEADHRQVKATAKLSAKVKQKKSDKKKEKFTGRQDVAVSSSSVDEKLMTAGELQKLKNHRIEAAKQKGFCEICDIKYDNMLQHLNTEKHKSFVEDVDNYGALDKLICQFHDQTVFQLIDPMRKFSKVMAPSSVISSEADECDLNLLTLPSSSLSSNFKIKVPPEWSNSCSAFVCGGGNNGKVQAANNTYQQTTSNLPPKPTADERKPEEPGTNHCSVENTCNNNPWEKHSGFNEQKSCEEDLANCAYVDRNALNGTNVVGRLGDFRDYRCENVITTRASDTLRHDDSSRGKVESEASCKTNAASVSPLNIRFVQQLDDLELDSEDVSSEIPVIQPRHHCKEDCRLDLEQIHVSAEPPLAQPITFAPEDCTVSCELALSAFPVLQPSNHTDQLRLQSQISCHTSATGSPCECYKRHHSGVSHSPSKCRKRCRSDIMDSRLKCQKLPLPEVTRLDSLDSAENRFLSQRRKRIKFYRAVSVLTNRSVLELFESDTSSDFEGFDQEYEPVASDRSYDEVSEAVLSIDSDFEWESPSCASRSNAHSTDVGTIFSENPMTSTTPIIASADKDYILKMAFDSESPVTHSISNRNVRTIDELSNLESDTELYLPNDTSSNLSGVFNYCRKDTHPSFTDNYSSLCTSEQGDILDYIDKDESDLLVKPMPLTENSTSCSTTNDRFGSNQLSVDDKSSSVMAVNVKLGRVPANVKLPLTLTNVKDTRSRSWQPVVTLRKCDGWERGCAGDKEEQTSASDSCSAVQDELLTRRDAYSCVEASKRRRKLNFSRANNRGQSFGLKGKKSLRTETKCSRMMKSLPSENLSTSSDLCCAVKMPEALNVLDLVDLESKEEENNVGEVLTTGIPNDGRKSCSESSAVNYWDRNSVDSHFSDLTAKHKTRSNFTKGEHPQNISKCTVSCETFTALKSNKTLGAGEISMQTEDFTQTSTEVRNAIVACDQRTRELTRIDQDFNENGASSDAIAIMRSKSCYDDIRHHKMWQPVVTLDRFSVKTNVSCRHHRTASVSRRSDTGHVAKMSSMQNEMVSIKPLSSFDSVFVLEDTFGSEMSFARNEDVLSDEGKLSRRLVVLLNRCDSHNTVLSLGVSTQKTTLSNKAGLPEKQNLLANGSHDEYLDDTRSLNNLKKVVNVAVDLKRNNGTCRLHEPEVKDIGRPTLGNARICRSKTFRNSDHRYGSIGVNGKKELTRADMNLRNTIGTDIISGCVEEPLEAVRRISLPSSAVMQNSVIEKLEIASSGINSSNGPISNTISKSSEIVGVHNVKRSIYSRLNRSLSRKYLDWSKPETYVASNNAKFSCTSNTNPTECPDSSRKIKVRRYQCRSRSYNHFLPRSKADWSKTLSPE